VWWKIEDEAEEQGGRSIWHEGGDRTQKKNKNGMDGELVEYR